jgi:hypothetical protein
MKSRFASLAPLALLALLAGCASSTHTLREETAPPGAPASPYVAEPGRDAATVAAMRAAPYTDSDIGDGHNRGGDAARLAAQGYVRIGSARYPAGTQARDDATGQARRVGADKVLLYAPTAAAANAADWIADYYVRFRLPFGATFRDLDGAERSSLGVAGGVQIGAVVGGTPASRANLLAGDFVVSVDGRPIADKAEFQRLLKAGGGRAVTLGLIRNGEALQRVVRLDAQAPVPAH